MHALEIAPLLSVTDNIRTYIMKNLTLMHLAISLQVHRARYKAYARREGREGERERLGRHRHTHFAWASSSYLFLTSSSSDCVVSSADCKVLTLASASASRARAREEDVCSSLWAQGEPRGKREEGMEGGDIFT